MRRTLARWSPLRPMWFADFCIGRPKQPAKGWSLPTAPGVIAMLRSCWLSPTQFSAAGLIVLRCDLAFRRQRPKGPPFPATAARGSRELAESDELSPRYRIRPLFLGGHSYGGRQASMLAAEEPDLAAALLLLSYPLHPPNKPAQLRTEHFSKLRTRSVFVSGTNDPFGSPAELEKAISLAPIAPAAPFDRRRRPRPEAWPI